MNEDVMEPLSKVLHSGYITQGEKVEEFEDALNEKFETKYAVTLNSATSGLTLALRLLDLEPGDQVLSTPLSCMATNLPILANNLDVKWVDVDPNTCNMDLKDLKKKMTAKTRAIMFVHWGGSPLDMNKLEELKDYYRETFGKEIHVIEDCAHAFGSRYNGKMVGNTHNNISVFSFSAIKHLTTGDGGFMILRNRQEYNRAKLLRWFGIDRRKRSGKGKDFRLEHDVKEWGYKFHMNDIVATIGLSNLPHIQENVRKHRENAEYFNKKLRKLMGVTPMIQAEGADSAYWIYSIRVVNKQSFMDHMERKGIMCSQVHKRNDVHTVFEKYKTSLPNLDTLESQLVSIPVGWWLSEKEREYIYNSIEDWCIINYGFYHVRELLPLDYDKGFLELLSKSYGKKIYLSFENFCKRLETMRAEGSVTYVALSMRGQIVGTGRIKIETKFGDSVGYIEDVYVDADYRKKRIGTDIVMTLVDRGTAWDCHKIVLNSKLENEAFYTKSNFRKTQQNMYEIRNTIIKKKFDLDLDAMEDKLKEL